MSAFGKIKYFIKDNEYYENVINFYITLEILVALGHRFKNTFIPMPFVFRAQLS